MRILFTMPNYKAPSEVWMQRMLDMLKENVELIAVIDSFGISYWNTNTKVISLFPKRSILTKLLGKFGYNSPRKKLIQEIRGHKITHIFCHYGTWANNLLSVWEEVKLPLFVHFHGYDSVLDLRKDDNPDELYHDKKIYNEAKIIKLSQLSTFIANSVFTKSKLVNMGVSIEKIVIKYIGVPIPVKNIKEFNSLSDVIVLSIGRLVDCKSPDRTIIAFEKAVDMGLRGLLIIIGDGPQRNVCENLRQKSRYRKDIKLLGALDFSFLETYFLKADIYTQHNIVGDITKQEEAYGVSVVEAMSYGLPVVGTKNGGIMETVVDKVTGILVRPGDVDAQAEALFYLYKNPDIRIRMGEAARTRVEEKFSIEKERIELYKILNT